MPIYYISTFFPNFQKNASTVKKYYFVTYIYSGRTINELFDENPIMWQIENRKSGRTIIFFAEISKEDYDNYNEEFNEY